MSTKNSSQSFFNALKEKLTGVKPLLISHHPDCPHYNHHVFHFRKFQLCIGCSIGYPISVVTLFLFSFVLFPSSGKILDIVLLSIGILSFLTFLLSFTTLTQRRWIKIMQKGAIGFGGAVIASFILSRHPDQPWFVLLFNLWGIWMMAISPLAFMRYRSMIKQCDECPDRDNLEICPLSTYFEK